MKLNPIQHRVMINRALASIAFKGAKISTKWKIAMYAMRGAYQQLIQPRAVEVSGLKCKQDWSSFSIDDADMNYRKYGDETIIDGDKKETTSVINPEYACSVINKF